MSTKKPSVQPDTSNTCQSKQILLPWIMKHPLLWAVALHMLPIALFFLFSFTSPQYPANKMPGLPIFLAWILFKLVGTEVLFSPQSDRMFDQKPFRVRWAYCLYMLGCLLGVILIPLMPVGLGLSIVVLACSKDMGWTLTEVTRDRAAPLLQTVVTPSTVSLLAQNLKETIYWLIAVAQAVLMRIVGSTGTVIPVIIPTRPGHGKAVSPRAP